MERNENELRNIPELHSDFDVAELSAARLAEIILQDKSGTGLRSRIPSVYVWNDDRIFFVSRISFPGRAASRDRTENVALAVTILQCLGYFPQLREAVYHSMHMRDHRTISKEDTWWGMNHVDDFRGR